jgi:hypothetical protein
MKFLVALTTIFIAFGQNCFAAGDNHAGLFLGATTLDDETDFTLGLDYERLTGLAGGTIGYGVLLDNNFAEKNIFIVGLPVFWHPWQGLKLLVAPGYEFKEGGGTDKTTGKKKKAKQKYLTRVGVGYDFHVDSYSIGPIVSVDLIDGGDTGVVYGLAVGTGF